MDLQIKHQKHCSDERPCINCFTDTGECLDAPTYKLGGHYNHYKGGIYRLLAVADLEEQPDIKMAVYQEVDNGITYTRPLSEFQAKFVETDKYPSHSISCLYQYELDFLNLQDTHQMRILFWSAQGALQFDERDRVILPHHNPHNCPCQLNTGEDACGDGLE